MTTYILGISGFDHDAAAALMKDGKIVAAAEEERFSRVKHQTGIPHGAIDFVLGSQKISMDDISHIAIDFIPSKTFIGRGKYWLWQAIKGNPLAFNIFLSEIGNTMVRTSESSRLGIGFGRRIPVHWVPHHVAHVYSTYCAFDLQSAAVLSLDFMGENNTSYGGVFRGKTLDDLINISFPHSLGSMFAGLTEYLGFEKLSDEYKVMGLASYGKPKFINQMRETIMLLPDGRFKLNLDFFDFSKTLGRTAYVSQRFIDVFGLSRLKGEEVSDKHANIAASLQQVLGETIMHMAEYLKEKTNEDALCFSGGVALNCVANQLLAKSGLFEKIFIHPAPYDAGASLGATYFVWHNILGNEESCPLTSAYLGPSFENFDYQSLLASSGYHFEKLDDAEAVALSAASDLSKKKVIGWFQDKMEWGPRALGNRSILADPRDKNMIDRVNLKIKYREPFRPFAPSAMREYANQYFELVGDPRFMLYTVDATKKAQEEIPAVVHIDNTSRVQVVDKESNPKYWSLINRFREITGVPVILNTSFNIKGEPIVCTPQEALRCFSATGLDVLYMQDYKITKLD
ncbi:MAG: carbamoyltransferase C-terminal domain-containing protein [archaeon]